MRRCTAASETNVWDMELRLYNIYDSNSDQSSEQQNVPELSKPARSNDAI